MKTHPAYIVAVLLIIEGAILFLAERSVGKKIFKVLPSMFWIYFLPMLANTFGLLPAESPVYRLLTQWMLPAALIVLLLSADIGGITRLGPTALGVMAAGMIGIMLGAPVVLLVFGHWLPANAWQGIGPLSGSWIGGSANMVAVKEAIKTPDDLFKRIIIVDTIVPYAWMGLLIALSSHQQKFDRWNHSNTKLIEELAKRTATNGPATKIRFSITGLLMIFLIAAMGTVIAVIGSNQLPAVKNIISPIAWSVIIATILGVCISFTPASRLQSSGSNRIGFIMLYLVLASIGAKTRLSYMADLPIFLIVGFTWIGIHAVCLLLAARLLKAPMALAAAASQSCIGGPASGPIIAGIYHPDLASVGLLLAVLGNILGTFLALFTTGLCRLL